jgi:peptidoglycan-associated lipoprotein
MKRVLTSSIHLFVLASLLFVTAACQQRPKRPSPDQTMSGMGPGDNLPFNVVNGGSLGSSSLLFDETSLLQPRSAADLYGEQVRGLLEPIYFEFDRSGLGSTERNKAMAAAEHLRSNPRNRLLIEGHCDWRGTTEYNLGLGDRRATSVKDYLVSIGVESSRLEILSKGDLEAAQGGSEQQMARDRRAELVVLQN